MDNNSIDIGNLISPQLNVRFGIDSPKMFSLRIMGGGGSFIEVVTIA